MPVVHIKNIDFTPAVLHIKRGGHVEWKWEDQVVSHTVTSRGKKRFKSAGARRSGTYTVTFTKQGTYRYVCTIHPNMKGRVIVD